MHRTTLAFLLVPALLLSSCSGGPTTGLFDRRTPRERYLASLQAAGLGDTALVRDWIAAGETALLQPQDGRLPLNSEIRQGRAEPRAWGYRLPLQRGRRLRVELTVSASEPAIVFVELFNAADLLKPIAASSREEVRLEQEIYRDGTYTLRIQPELLRGDALRIVQRTTASLTFPVSGRTSSAVKSFFLDPRDNKRRDHHGIDIFAPRNTAVVAAAGGLVTQVGTSTLGGNVVWIWDAGRQQSHYYAHLHTQAVAPGDLVDAGAVVGYVGNSGNARTTLPHLHFGIYSRGEGPIDPLPFVRE